MTPVYRFRAIMNAKTNILEAIPGELADLNVRQTSRVSYTMATWRFHENRFALIPALRDWLSQQGVRYIEEGFRAYSEGDAAQANLSHFTGGAFRDLKVVDADFIVADRCSDCGLSTKRIKDHPKLRLASPATTLPPLYWVPDAGIKVATEGFLKALDEQNLGTGLATFPVEIEGSTSEPYFALYSTCELGWPAAPWGYWGNLCQRCQHPTRKSLWPDDPDVYPGLPQYSFYFLFHRTTGEADWMWTELFGQNAILVSGRLRHWLQTEAIEYFGFSRDSSSRFDFLACGWYPDEVDEAFLPRPYRGPSADK